MQYIYDKKNPSYLTYYISDCEGFNDNVVFIDLFHVFACLFIWYLWYTLVCKITTKL